MNKDKHQLKKDIKLAKDTHLPMDGERYIPEMPAEIELEQLHRYALALQLCAGKIVLDIASGEGYGSYLMSTSAKAVFGVDISEEAIRHSQSKYTEKNLKFMVGTCSELPLKDGSVDLVVSFETIEHHDQHEEMMLEISRVLTPDGVLLISSPDKENYSCMPATHNHFHVKELYRYEFEGLLNKYFENVAVYGQSALTASITLPEKAQNYDITRSALVGRTLVETPFSAESVYQIAVASNGPVPTLNGSIFDSKRSKANQQTRGAKLFEAKLYWSDANIEEGTPYSESRSSSLLYSANGKIQDLEIKFFIGSSKVTSLRLDPLNMPGIVQILAGKLVDSNNETIWTWTQDRHALPEPVGAVILADLVTPPASLLSVVSYSDDPWFEVPIPENILLKIDRDCFLVLSVRAYELEEQLGGVLDRLLQQRETLTDTKLGLENSVKDTTTRLEQYRLHHYSVMSECDQLRNTAATLREDIYNIRASLSWKITSPLRTIFNILKVPARAPGQKPTSLENIWGSIPLRPNIKHTAKKIVFTLFKYPLQYTRVYKDWIEYEAAMIHAGISAVYEPDGTAFERELNGRSYIEICTEPNPTALPVKLIAFYLPQFHAIPENDQWWGEGFTEWTNVKPGKPQYNGHYQPHVPGELGYYDLTDVAVQKRQVELAQLYGIGGFCFYFYWFAGQRLLEAPTLQYLNNSELDLPFFLCWANESWSRTWDGLESEMLISQGHSAEDDLHFIEYVAKYFRDQRYIKINDRPVLMVYRPSLLPDPKGTALRWRTWCSENGIGDIYLITTHSFDTVDPSIYGFDAAVEFPPNNTAPAVVTGFAPQVNDGFEGIVYDWKSIAERSESYPQQPYQLFRTVNPAWDNTARRKSRGAIFAGSNPLSYQIWLENAAKDTIVHTNNKDERLVFVNAWNEWAEGAHLEPDQTYGYAYLQATRDALENTRFCTAETQVRRVLLVAHDAYFHGAQSLVLHIAKFLSEDFGFRVDMVVLGDGPLLTEYAKYATLYSLAGLDHRGPDAAALAAQLTGMGHTAAICNTTVSGLFVETLSKSGLYIVTLIHELSEVVSSYNLDAHVHSISKFSNKIVFPSKVVQQSFESLVGLETDRIHIRTQGIYKPNLYRTPEQRATARRDLRDRFNLPEEQKVVLCVGYADHRKGIDLFVDIAMNVLASRNDVTFIWLGHFDLNLEQGIKETVRKSNHSESFIFPGQDPESHIYFAGADIYALTSREDPFPTVIMEALESATPVIAFEGTGGFTELLQRGCGLLVPAFDTTGFSQRIEELLSNQEVLDELGSCGEGIIKSEYSFRQYLFDLLELIHSPIKKVSVIVPNYNYEAHIEERLSSIIHQSYPIYEIIVLDDASVDGSVRIIKEQLVSCGLDNTLIINPSNSGSPFHQWHRGALAAKGDYLWIAEADDVAERGFLETVVRAFEDPDVLISYCESVQVDENGMVLANDYRYYLNDISEEKWKANYVKSGGAEIRQALAIKNTIPNASAVLFGRAVFCNVMEEKLDEVLSYRYAGDWRIYVEMLIHGKIAFSAMSLNRHRRHGHSVTLSNFTANQLREIIKMQSLVSQLFEIDDHVVTASRNYVQLIYEQFELNDQYPDILDNPDFSSASEK